MIIASYYIEKMLNVFDYLSYTQGKVNNHILSHVAAFISKRMGNLLLLLEPKIGNITVKINSISVIIANLYY